MSLKAVRRVEWPKYHLWLLKDEKLVTALRKEMPSCPAVENQEWQPCAILLKCVEKTKCAFLCFRDRIYLMNINTSKFQIWDLLLTGEIHEGKALVYVKQVWRYFGVTVEDSARHAFCCLLLDWTRDQVNPPWIISSRCVDFTWKK